MIPCYDSHSSGLLGLHVSLSTRVSHLHCSTSHINSSILSLDFNDLTSFCNTMKVTSFSSSVSRNAFLFFLCCRCSGLCFLVMFCFCFFYLFAAAFFNFLLFFFIAAALLLLSCVRLSCCRFAFVVIVSYASWNVTINVSESLPASAFSFHVVSFFLNGDSCAFKATHSLVLALTLLSHHSTAHSRCDEIFCEPHVHVLFDFWLDVLKLAVLERYIGACSDNYVSSN